MLSQFLSGTFPELIDPLTSDQCWVATAIRNQDPGLVLLSEAIEVVDTYGEVNSFRSRLKREHPSNREHNLQYDARVRDCLTEACAFAWVALRELGTPAFSDTEGTPDICLDDDRWVEVKGIHVSQEEDARMKHMLAGEVDSGQVTLPGPGLYRKFTHALMDAIMKFDRQPQQKATDSNFVFFNLTSLDTPQMLKKDSVLADLGNWADEMENCIRANREFGIVKLVMCYGYNWKAPFRDPLKV